MIEKQNVEGRDAVVSYLKAGFEPAGKDDATLIKVTFEDDQSSFWLAPHKEAEAKDAKPKLANNSVLSKIRQALNKTATEE